MNKAELQSYHYDQMEIIKKNREALTKQGFVKSYKDVYPDIYTRIKGAKSTAYIRGNVSLKIMVLLYDVVIVYIPPLSVKQLLNRFDLNNWEELITLCQQSIVIPIIGRAEQYTAPHFSQLFNRLIIKPYSLWARGLALLDVFGMENSLEIAKEVLPVDKIAEDKRIFALWTKIYKNRDEKYIRDRIKDDIAVQYADLCIFGCKDQADYFSKLTNPKEIYDGIKLLNEVRTYPILFGLESQANFESSKLKSLVTLPLDSQAYIPQALPEKELKILFEGVGINVNKVEVDNIIAYRKDGLGRKLREALSGFNDYCDERISKKQVVDYNQVYNRALSLQEKIGEAVNDLNCNNYYAEMNEAYNKTTKLLTIGTIAAGGAITICTGRAGFPFAATVGFFAGSIVSTAAKYPDLIAETLVKFETEKKYNKFVANMWSVQRMVGKKNAK